MKKINVGIITLNGYHNYGNRLQNLALSEVYSKTGCYVATKWKKDKKKYFKDLIKRHIWFIPKYKRFSKFYTFSKKYIKEINNLDNIDLVVIGSDQVWNPIDALRRNELLGININIPMVSYAASFGVSKIDKKYYNLYNQGLSKLLKVSVRETAGLDLFNDITSQKKSIVLIDPTMLLSKDEWDKFSHKPKQFNEKKKYILNYFLGGMKDEYRKKIENFAYENKCEIINILDKNDKYYCSDPGEFLYLEKNAYLICTDSFHSSVFAFIYNRPFIVFDRNLDNSGNMSSRIDTLLSKFKLQDRRYRSSKLIDDYLEYNYDNSFDILDLEKEKSQKFINETLKIIKK